ncbi:MAG: hypothetical protein FJ117_16170 [Deltaproteobacteria bacterium]|nr:hypothetical protein [Deltaproteobacteria bacterium]
MIQVEEERPKFPPCGYGLLGLCCSDCLAGPCRVSPFEKEHAKGLCGADADLLVARNLLRLTVREGARSLKSFREVLREFRDRGKTQEFIAVAEGAYGKQIVCKYKIPEAGSEKIVSFLEGVSSPLLAPFANEPPSLFPTLFPETVFPHLRQEPPPGSLTEELLELLKEDQKGSDAPEECWRRCLRASVQILMAEELRRDLFTLLHPASSREDGWEGTRKFLEGLPGSAQPLLICFSPTGGFQSPTMERLAQGLTQHIPQLHSLYIREVSDFARNGRFLHKKWSRPVSGLATVVLVESFWVLPTLASLALGFVTASHPPLPVQGSEKAKRFFTEELGMTRQNFYLAGGDETAFSRLCQSFQERIS